MEDDKNVGDGAFSGGGACGVYPWIWKPRPEDDSGDDYDGWTDPLYGVLASDNGGSDESDPDYIDTPDASIGWPSVLCGRAIRKAFLTGIAQ